MDLDKIADFVQKYAPQYKNREKIKEYVNLHLLYKTIFIGYDYNGDVSYVCRWNIEGNRVLVLDFYCREDYRNKGMIHILLKNALYYFPYLKEIGWERSGIRKKDRGIRYYPIENILKRKW